VASDSLISHTYLGARAVHPITSVITALTNNTDHSVRAGYYFTS